MKQGERAIIEGIHPSHIVDGIELAKKKAAEFLETCKYTPPKPAAEAPKEGEAPKEAPAEFDREFLLNVARTSLQTKLTKDLADQLTEIVVDAVLCVRKDGNIDLHMVEIMHMVEKLQNDTRFVKGLVLDHGGRHPEMPKRLENCYILNCNVSLEYEKTEVYSKFIYSNSEQREKLIKSERAMVDEQCLKIIELKRKVCDSEEGKKGNKHFVVINYKGIDPLSLDLLAKEGILGLRRCKRRNMERLVLMCGGNNVNSFDELTEKDLGYADLVYEQSLGDEKYTYIEGVKNPHSCTILIKGSNDYGIAQIKDAVRDGLRAVKNVFDDNCVIPGAGAFEIACADHLRDFAKDIGEKSRYGVLCYADAMEIIPKSICRNSGLDPQDCLAKCSKEYRDKKALMGIDIKTGEPVNPIDIGILDNYCVKKSFLHIGPVLAQQLLLVDEVMRAGKQMQKDKIA